MAGSQSTSALAAEDAEDSEWEYEYHDTETESFYVTLDISSAIDYKNPRANKQKPQSPPPKPPQPTSSVAPTTATPQDNADPSEPPETPASRIPTPMELDQNPSQPEEEPSLSGPGDRIQILDLHTENPLISYRNQMYSCEWTSTLGTDLLLTTPTPDFPHPVLREQPDVLVLAASSIKLMGRPAQMVSRQSVEEGDQSTAPAPEKNSTTSATTTTPVKIPLGPTPSRGRQDQAKFLERLIAIKAKKGEKDSVTVHSQKAKQGSGWRSQRKASEVFEDGDDEIAPKVNRRGGPTMGRPRGSRRTRGPRTAKGGLFRDYRPQLWDTPGADIRARSFSTPGSWDQLEDAASDERQTPAITSFDASPLPAADQPLQMSDGNSRSLSASASANTSPTPSFPALQSTNEESRFADALAFLDPSLQVSQGQSQAIELEEDTMPTTTGARAS